MVNFMVRLPTTLHTKAKERAAKDETTLAYIIREALKAYLKEAEK